MKSFFKNNSEYSMGRLLSLIAVVGGIATGMVLAFNGKLDTVGASFCSGLVVAGITGKTVASKLNK